MKLFIVRHGETEHNRNGIVQGVVDSPLTAKGIEQAKKLGERLSKKKIDIIFCSPKGRAMQTLEYIKAFHKNIPVKYVDDLGERNYGIFDGKPDKDMVNDKGKNMIPSHEYTPPGGESFKDVQKRAISFIESIKGEYKDKNVLLVAHGRLNKILITTLLGRSLSQTNEIQQRNCCLNILEISGNSAKALVINETGFL